MRVGLYSSILPMFAMGGSYASSSGKYKERFLLPVTKQTFKQGQRKERKLSARKRSRKKA